MQNFLFQKYNLFIFDICRYSCRRFEIYIFKYNSNLIWNILYYPPFSGDGQKHPYLNYQQYNLTKPKKKKSDSKSNWE
ncbi:hypothetical protein FA950_28900 [Bacillus thuringiensis]|nr:hypothetical protein FA950_28900 [Bacillus thuringiensis]